MLFRSTTITFFPDPDIFETTDFNYSTLKHRIQELAYLNKGLRIVLKDSRALREMQEEFYYEGGIVEYVDVLNGNKGVLEKPFYIHSETDNYQVEIAMQYNDSYSENIYSYANNINTHEGGTHLDGFKAVLTKLFNDYAGNFKMLKKDRKSVV